MEIRKDIIEQQNVLKPLVEQFGTKDCYLETKVTPYFIDKVLKDATPDAEKFRLVSEYYINRKREYDLEISKAII